MNAREALQTLQQTHQWLCNIQDDDEHDGNLLVGRALPNGTGFTATGNAITTLSAVLTERDALREACEALIAAEDSKPAQATYTTADNDAWKKQYVKAVAAKIKAEQQIRAALALGAEKGGSMKPIGERIHEQKVLSVWQLRKLAKLLSLIGDWELHGRVCDLIKELSR